MKQNILIIGMLFLCISSAYGQVGVNTENPQGAFHVDGGKDNPATGVPDATQQKNDFAVTKDGYVGIRTASPGSSLDIKGSIALPFRYALAPDSGPVTITEDDYEVEIYGTPNRNNAVGIMLPSAKTRPGRKYIIRNITTNKELFLLSPDVPNDFLSSDSRNVPIGGAVRVQSIGFGSDYFWRIRTEDVNTNLYNSDGSIPVNREVKVGSNKLMFSNSEKILSIDGNSGNIGIGANSPSAKLEINSGTTNGAIKIVDGTQGAGKVLTSNADGVGTWQTVALTSVIGSTPTATGIGNYSFHSDTSATAWKQTGTYITLPAGKWRVDVTQLMKIEGDPITANDYMWIRFTFSDDGVTSSPSPTSDFSGSKYISGTVMGPTVAGANKYSIAQGSVIINNTSGAAKTYHFIGGYSVSSLNSTTSYVSNLGGSWAENSITAFPLSN